MNAERHIKILLIPALLTGLVLPVRGAEGQPPAAGNQKAAVGAIVGVVRNSAKMPIAGATVTSAKTDGTGLRATVSTSDGIYSFADVAPGEYSVSSQADGYRDTVVSTIRVVAAKATRTDILFESVPPQPAVISSNVPSNKVAPRPATQPAPPSANPVQSAWARRLRELVLPSPPPVTTASLKNPPAAAFDKAAVDAPDALFPLPQPAPAAPAKPAREIPEALSAPDPGPEGVDNVTPFAFGDFTWLNGAPRNKDTVLDTKFFTPEIRFDTHFMEDFNQPMDHTIVGATESFRSGEVQIEQASVGGDFHWQNVRGRILFMNGLFATTTPRNDASSATGSAPGNTGGVGQWDLQNAYKYVSEAWGGYHFNVQHGLNVDAGIFVSYIGLFSYYNYDNWTYQPSYVSSNTPWFFNGVRIQWFPTNKMKFEPWIINGWQSYAKFNGHVGLGGQFLWQPTEWFKLVANQYGYGEDNLGLPHTQRIHTDDSIEVRYYNNPTAHGISKAAFTLTVDAGCQYGGGITCHNGPNKSDFIGWMAYDRYWFHHDTFAITLGGGMMGNPGRYLTLLPPIDGAWAAVGSAYFTELPGQGAHMQDGTVTFQYMPKQYITWWGEWGYRHSDIPYFAGRGGVTPPGGNNGLPQYYTCASGASAMTNNLGAAETACGGGLSSVWFPDLRKSETKLSVGVMVKF
jgi:Putative beta-barrel porin-2, OmpL-like. bbp2/Carboxypeptidase regulatory-like domain